MNHPVLINPWLHLKEPPTVSNKLSASFLDFKQHDPHKSLSHEGREEVQCHYWGGHGSSIIRAKLFKNCKSGLEWKFPPRKLPGSEQMISTGKRKATKSNSESNVYHELGLGHGVIFLVGLDSEATLGMHPKSHYVVDTDVRARTAEAGKRRTTASLPSRPKTAEFRQNLLGAKERMKVLARPSKNIQYGDTLLLQSTLEQEVILHSPRFAHAAKAFDQQRPGPLLPGYGLLRCEDRVIPSSQTRSEAFLSLGRTNQDKLHLNRFQLRELRKHFEDLDSDHDGLIQWRDVQRAQNKLFRFEYRILQEKLEGNGLEFDFNSYVKAIGPGLLGFQSHQEARSKPKRSGL